MSRRAHLFVFALLLAVGAFVIVGAHGTGWLGEWNFSLDTAVGVTVLTGPVVGAYAGWIAAEERRRASLVDSTPRGWMAPLRAAACATLLGLAAFLVGLVGVFLATASVTHGGPLDWWIGFIVVPVLALNAVLGAVVGRLWPIRVLIVLVAPALFLLGALPGFGLGPQLLRHGLATGSMAGQTWRVDVHVGQTVVMVALIGVVGACLAIGARVRPLLGTSVVVLGSLVALGVGAGLPSDYDDAVRTSDEEATACAGTAPRVCVFPSNRRSLAAISRQMERAAEPLIEAGADVPDTYLDSGYGGPGPRDLGSFTLIPEANGSYALEDAIQQIVEPSPCPQYRADVPPPDAVWEAKYLIANWIAKQFDRPGSPFSPEADRWARTAPADQQERVIVRLFGQLRSCDLDALELPWQT